MHRELVQVDGSGVVVDNELGGGLFVGQVLDLELWVLEADEIVVGYLRCSEVIGESLDLNPSVRVEVLDSAGLLTVVARGPALFTDARIRFTQIQCCLGTPAAPDSPSRSHMVCMSTRPIWGTCAATPFRDNGR